MLQRESSKVLAQQLKIICRPPEKASLEYIWKICVYKNIAFLNCLAADAVQLYYLSLQFANYAGMPVVVTSSDNSPAEGFQVPKNKIVRITKTVTNLNPVTLSVVDGVTKVKHLFLNNQPSLTLFPKTEKGKMEYTNITLLCKYNAET